MLLRGVGRLARVWMEHEGFENYVPLCARPHMETPPHGTSTVCRADWCVYGLYVGLCVYRSLLLSRENSCETTHTHTHIAHTHTMWVRHVTVGTCVLAVVLRLSGAELPERIHGDGESLCESSMWLCGPL